MKRISSECTFFYKRIFPTLWFGFLAVSVVVVLFGKITGNAPLLLFLLTPLLMALLGYFIMKQLIFDLVDEVYDNGDSLTVKNKGQEDLIRFINIVNVSYSTAVNPARITLSLKEPSKFGKEITFSPPMGSLPFKKHPLATELIERINSTKGS